MKIKLKKMNQSKSIKTDLPELLSKPLFIAIPVPFELSNILEKLITQNLNDTNIRWIPCINYHLTILYLGRIDLNLISSIKAAVENALNSLHPFWLTMEKITLYPPRRNSKMIWAKFFLNKDFQSSRELIRKALFPIIKIEPEHKESIPHITMARIKKMIISEELYLNSGAENFKLPVNSFELWESNQGSAGVFYKSISSFRFGVKN